MKKERKDPRYKKDLDVDYKKEAETGHGVSKNISKGGVFVHSDKTFLPSSKINLMLYLPDGTISSLKGVVRHSSAGLQKAGGENELGMGIEFLEIDANFTNFMNNLVKEILSRCFCPSCGHENIRPEDRDKAVKCAGCGKSFRPE
jgi:NADH pyrophosphatase NudC (nudix superfamily)